MMESTNYVCCDCDKVCPQEVMMWLVVYRIQTRSIDLQDVTSSIPCASVVFFTRTYVFFCHNVPVFQILVELFFFFAKLWPNELLFSFLFSCLNNLVYRKSQVPCAHPSCCSNQRHQLLLLISRQNAITEKKQKPLLYLFIYFSLFFKFNI